jgi:hypothetical protein
MFNKLPVEVINQIFDPTNRADLLNLAVPCKRFTRSAELSYERPAITAATLGSSDTGFRYTVG